MCIVHNKNNIFTELQIKKYAEPDNLRVFFTPDIKPQSDLFYNQNIARGNVPENNSITFYDESKETAPCTNPLQTKDVAIEKKKRKQVVDQITFDGAVTCLETATIKTNLALNLITKDVSHLHGLPKLMSFIGESPFIAGRAISTFVNGAASLSYKIAPKETKTLSNASKAIIKPVEEALPKVKNSVLKKFPTGTRVLGRAIPYASVVSSAGFAIYDTKNAKNLIEDKKSSNDTKKYAIATASLSWISLGSATALTFAPRAKNAASVIAAISGGTSMITFGASIYTSVKMEWAKNKDGLN